jgi:hypothetical protein
MIYVKGIVYDRYQIIFFQMDTLTLGGSYEVSGFGFLLLRSSLLTPETRHLKPDLLIPTIRNDQLPVTNSRELHLDVPIARYD